MAGGAELGEVRQPPVAQQPVAAGQAQRVALAGGQQRFAGVGEALDERHRVRREIGAQQQAARFPFLGRVGGVVEQRDQPPRLEFGVVLPVEAHAAPELEARVPAVAQQPVVAAGVHVHVIQRPRVARGEHHIARFAGARPPRIGARPPGGDRVDVNVIPGVFPGGDVVERVPQRNVPERVPLPHHQAGLDVDLLDDRVQQDPVRGAVHRGEVHVDRVEGVDPGGALGREQDLVQVGAVAVAGADGGDLLVGAVVDHVFALAEPHLDDAALPPGERRFAFVALHLEVGGGVPARQRVKPHQRAVLFGDHRPGRPQALVGGEEEVAAGRAGPRRRRERDGRGGQFGRREVVLHGVRVARVERELHLADGRLMGDGEGGGDRLIGSPPTRARERMHGDALARDERPVGDEALAGAGGVRLQTPRVGSAARADHAHARDPRARAAEEADLRGGRGVGGPGQRRDRDGVGGRRGDRGLIAERDRRGGGAAAAGAERHGEQRRGEQRAERPQSPRSCAAFALIVLLESPRRLSMDLT